MKTKCIKMDWLIPFAGIGVVAATLVATTTYLDLERSAQDAVACCATFERLRQDRQLSLALREIHEGKTTAAAQRLDLLLCENILLTDSELASADGGARPMVEEVFREMALIRPSIAQRGASGSAEAWDSDQVAAEKVLRQSLETAQIAQTP